MLQIIRHRMNQSSLLVAMNPEDGVEIDLRSDVRNTGAIHLAHDPWVIGESLEFWLDTFLKCKIKGPLVLNTKEDLLEEKIQADLLKAGIKNYFFIDTALPTLFRHSHAGKGEHFSVRLSCFEPNNFAVQFSGKIKWLWVDCFNKVPLEEEKILALKDKFKICLVSPELHGGTQADIKRFIHLKKSIDAVCTKHPASWSSS